MKEEYEYKKSNRQKRLTYKSGLFWCWGCDASLVSSWKKCKVCGKKNLPKRNKRD